MFKYLHARHGTARHAARRCAETDETRLSTNAHSKWDPAGRMSVWCRHGTVLCNYSYNLIRNDEMRLIPNAYKIPGYVCSNGSQPGAVTARCIRTVNSRCPCSFVQYSIMYSKMGCVERNAHKIRAVQMTHWRDPILLATNIVRTKFLLAHQGQHAGAVTAWYISVLWIPCP